MPLTTTTFTEILKIHYQGPIREQVTQKNVLLSNLRKDLSRRMFKGKNAYIPLHIGRNVGVGVRAESAILPTAGSQQYSHAEYTMPSLYGRIAVTGQTVAASRDDEGAFARAIASEMSGLVNDLSHSINRQLWHDGSGLLTDTTTETNTVNLTVADSKFLQAGMPIQIRTRDDGTLNAIHDDEADASITISSITSATEVVVSEAVTTGTAEGIYVFGSRDATSTTTWAQPYEMWGLEALVGDGDPADTLRGEGATTEDGFGSAPATTAFVGGITRATNSWWQSTSTDSGTWTIDLIDLQQAYDNAEIEGEAVPGLILTSHAVRRHYASQLTDARRFGDELVLQGGWTGAKFGNAAIVPDKWASTTNNPANSALTNFPRLYVISPESMEFQVLQELEWEDTGGVVVRSGVGAAAKDEVEAYMRTYMNLCVTRPNANGVLWGIT